MRRLSICLLFMLFLVPAAAQPSGADRVSASLSSNKIGLDETAILTVRIQGVGDIVDISPPTATPRGLQITTIGRQYSMSNINGVTQASSDFNFLITPTAKGRFVIDDITVNVGASTVTTPSLRLEVTDAVGSGSSYTYQPPNPWGVPNHHRGNTTAYREPPSQPDDVLLEAEIEPSTVYEHQPVYYSMRLLTAVRLLGDPHYNPMDPTGFVAVRFPQENFETQREGRAYAASQVQTAYYPLTEGTYTIEPIQMQLRAGLFGQSKVLTTEAKTVKVLPLPKEGRPVSYTGAVGEQFELAAYIDRTSLKAGQTAELRVEVRGDGHLDLVPYPFLPNWEGVEKRQLASQGSTEVVGNRAIESKKIYKFRLKIKSPGTYQLNGIALSYFRPSEERYETLKAQDLTITVEPGQAAALDAEDPQNLPSEERPTESPGSTAPIKTRVPSSFLGLSALLGVVGFLLSLAAGPVFHGKRPSFSRSRTVRPTNLEQLDQALAGMAPGHDSISRAEELLRRGYSPDQIARFERLKTRVSSARFGNAHGSGNVFEDLLMEFNSLSKELKR